MSANVEAMVREGSNALKAGRKEDARVLLMKAVELDQYNEEAWLWLSAVVETTEDQQTCLENVLAINPSNDRARQGLQYLQQQRTGSSPTVSPPPPLTSSPQAAPKAEKNIATSVEWAAPEGDSPASTSSTRKPLDLSEDDYDNWVSGLNLPTTAAKNSAEASPFFDDDDEPVFNTPTPAKPPQVKSAPPAAKAKQPVTVEEDEDNFDLSFEEPATGKHDAGVPEEPYQPLFPEIPDEIRATRLPGTRERLSIPLLLALVVLLALNIVAGIQLYQAVFGA
jgi:hypothetical protein